MNDTTPVFDRVAIIGIGLIGSSLARAMQANSIASYITCGDKSQDYCDKAMELGIVNEAYTDLGKAVNNADLIILCVPVGAMKSVAEEISADLKKGAIITDVGSVKEAVINDVQSRIPADVHLVPAHPIAGAEKSGPEAGIANLFHNRWCIVTPSLNTEIKAVEKVTEFWERCGSMIEIMDPKHHDMVLGITSHLPHLIAYTIVGTAADLENDTKAEVIKYSASGFRDFTRIAASDPTMWRDVFLNNKESVLDILQRFTEDLTELQKAIRQGDGETLYNKFFATRNIRQQIIDIGQADYPKNTKFFSKDD